MDDTFLQRIFTSGVLQWTAEEVLFFPTFNDQHYLKDSYQRIIQI